MTATTAAAPSEPRFEAFLLVDLTQAEETVLVTMRRLDHVLRKGFDWPAFHADPEKARRLGSAWLLRVAKQRRPHAYNNYVKLMNLLARFAGHDLHWRKRKEPKVRPKYYSYQEKWALALYRDVTPPPARSSWERVEEVTLLHRALIAFLAVCPLRPAELARVRVQDVSVTHGTIHVQQPAKDGYERTVPVLDRYALAPGAPLRVWLDGRPNPPDDDALWTTAIQGSARRIGPAMLRKHMWLIAESVGFPVNSTRFRHTLATDMFRDGHDLLSIAHMLGHTSVKSTEIYTFVTPDMIRKAHERLMRSRELNKE